VWSAGIVIGLIRDIPTCEELLSRIESEAENAIERLNKMSVAKAKL
jgi:NAD(P)H-dependent flavin oxidoreductase YrpB (nitropropane dioxygenase family)